MKIRLLFSLCFLLTLIGEVTHAQFVNNGNTIVIQNGGLLTVNGDFTNNSGTIVNFGSITLTGNWSNGNNTGAFNIASTGSVNFNGADQTIGGTQTTVFPNVILSGTGIKSLLINTSVNGTLNLNDREFSLANRNLDFLNKTATGITFSTGFISTDKKGMLYRSTNALDSYIFPMGSKVTGTLVYRPVSLIAKDNLNNTFGVTFLDKDPTTEGFDVLSKRYDVNIVNSLYFHILDQKQGNSAADFTFYFNDPGDGNFNQLVNWIKYNLWEKVGIANPQPFTGGNAQLNKLLTYSSIQTINSLPIALASIVTENNPLTFYNGFTPDGDGRNDRWEIRNIDLFPNNELTILNRWGSELFRTKGYTNAAAWDGLGLNNGTYFYLLKVNINGEDKVYKGSITLLRND